MRGRHRGLGDTEPVALTEFDPEFGQRSGLFRGLDPFGDQPATGRSREMAHADDEGLTAEICEYRLLARDQGFHTDVRPELVADIAVGAMLNQLLAPGSPPSATFARGVADLLLACLRRSP